MAMGVAHPSGIFMNAIQPKFSVGQLVSVNDDAGRGRWGPVVLWKPYPEDRYGLSLYPGALGGYEWIWVKFEGREQLLPINWISGCRLVPCTGDEG